MLADGTRALTKAGRWSDALRHIEQHKGIGKRMLDGRQVAILAQCTTGDYHAAIDMLDDSSTPEPWEQAVATCLRTLCLRIGNQPAETSAAAMVKAYLRLEPAREHLLFRTRLGLCVIDLTAEAHRVATSRIIARVIHEAVAGADAYSASAVLSHQLCRSYMAQADEDALANIVELSGLRRGTMPTNLLDDLMTSAKTSEAQLAQVLARVTRHPSTEK